MTITISLALMLANSVIVGIVLFYALKKLFTPDEDDSFDEMAEILETLNREKLFLSGEKIPELKTEIAELQLKRKIEDEEIQHMLKMRDARASINQEKYEQAADRLSQEAISKVKSEYADRLQSRLEEDIHRSDARFEQILLRLPSANIEILEDRNSTRDQLSKS